MFTLRRWSILLVVLLLKPACATAQTPVAPAVEAMLVQGNLDDARKQLEAQLDAEPQDYNARYALGIVQTLSGAEELMQSLHEHRLNPWWTTMLPFVRLPVPQNDDPTPLTNEAFRQMIADFSAELAKAEATLAEIPDDANVKLPLHLGLIRMDFNSDGKADENETLWKIFNRLAGRGLQVNQVQAEQFSIAFDQSDVYWLRGYCHLLQAVCDLHLAFDTQELHDHAAHLIFPSAKMKYRYVRGERRNGWNQEVFLDAIAFIHLLRFPIEQPERMQSAREHLLEVIALSRKNWASIEAETDDDREWLPGPAQTRPAIPGAAVSTEMVQGWREALDEFESILKGEKLIPFWRAPIEGDAVRGVNLKRFFTESQPSLDVILWVQGSGAEPYLEEGEITSTQKWRDINRIFRGRFTMFAFWFN